MKLLMISGDRSVLSGKRGAFAQMLEEFSKHWERIDVICPRSANPHPNPLSSEEERGRFFANVFFHPSPYSLWKQSSWIVQKGKELIAQHHHGVMTVHEYPPFYNGMGACHLHQATGVPYVLEVHHIVGWPRAASVTEWLGRIASHWQIPKSAYHAAAVRVVNLTVMNELVKWKIPENKIKIVPSFYLDASVYHPDPSATSKYDVIFCGRLVSNKGIREVLQAMVKLPEVTLLVIGDGPERAGAEAFVRRHGLADQVTFAGWLRSEQDVANAMRSGKIFVMNSKSEGGPRVALEAMACGLAVIATKVGAMPDVIKDGENGVLTTGYPEDLAKKIALLVGDEAKRRQLGKEAAKITEKFERKRLIREYAEFLVSCSGASSHSDTGRRS